MTHYTPIFDSMDPRYLLLQKVQPFSGTPGQIWEQWIARFETQASILKDDDRLHCLLMLLEGGALDTLTNQVVELDYAGAKNALSARFGTTVTQLQAHAELARACQEPGETVDSFSERLRSLGRLAYPSVAMGDASVDLTLNSRFLGGIRDAWLQEKLCQISPKSLANAVMEPKKLVSQQETIRAVCRPHPGQASVMPAVTNAPSAVGPEEDRLAALEMRMDDIQRNLQRVADSLPSSNRAVSDGPSTNHTIDTARIRSGRRRCYGCGEEGHLKRACPRQNGRYATDQPRGPMGRNPPPFCIGCGNQGHWMAECLRVPSANMGSATGSPIGRNPGPTNSKRSSGNC